MQIELIFGSLNSKKHFKVNPVHKHCLKIERCVQINTRIDAIIGKHYIDSIIVFFESSAAK